MTSSRDRHGKLRAAAMIAAVALVAFAAVACSSGEAERAAGEEPTGALDSNGTSSQTTSDQTPSRFVGTWTSTELSFDGSSQTMTIRPAEDGALNITLHDNSSARCSGGQSLLTGTGRLEDPTTLVVSSPALACVDGLERAGSVGDPTGGLPEEEAGGTSYVLVLDLATDRLFDNLEVAWHRGATPESRADLETECEAGSPGTCAMLGGEVTFHADRTWCVHQEACIDPQWFYTGVETESETGLPVHVGIDIAVNPLREASCNAAPPSVPASAEAVVRAIRSNPDLETTVPVVEQVGGIDALRFDVAPVPGASTCSDGEVPVVSVSGRPWGDIARGDLWRLYVLDLPGGSARALLIIISAPEASFARAVDAAAPVLDSFRFHSSPGPVVGWETFDSPLNGLSIGYSSGWRTRAATEPWGHDALAFGAPDVDVIFNPTLKEDLYLAVVSEPLDGTSGRDWPGDVLTDPSVGICQEAGWGSGGDDRLDGNYGYFYRCAAPLGRDHVAIIATATRGYIIYLHVGEEVPATYPVPAFAGGAFEGGNHFQGGILETVDLRPEDALDASNPSESP